jgi:hypothetical protein
VLDAAGDATAFAGPALRYHHPDPHFFGSRLAAVAAANAVKIMRMPGLAISRLRDSAYPGRERQLRRFAGESTMPTSIH